MNPRHRRPHIRDHRVLADNLPGEFESVLVVAVDEGFFELLDFGLEVFGDGFSAAALRVVEGVIRIESAERYVNGNIPSFAPSALT